MKPRPTMYAGVQMRSRLEAEYAASVDKLWGTEYDRAWKYEPMCYADETGQYLPDFVVAKVFFTEVKPTREAAMEAHAGMHPIVATHPDAVLDAVYPVGTYPNRTFALAKRCWPEEPCGCGRPKWD